MSHEQKIKIVNRIVKSTEDLEDDLEKHRKLSFEIFQENQKFQEENGKLAFDFVVKMIREGRKFDQVNKTLNKLKLINEEV